MKKIVLLAGLGFSSLAGAISGHAPQFETMQRLSDIYNKSYYQDSGVMVQLSDSCPNQCVFAVKHTDSDAILYTARAWAEEQACEEAEKAWNDNDTEITTYFSFTCRVVPSFLEIKTNNGYLVYRFWRD